MKKILTGKIIEHVEIASDVFKLQIQVDFEDVKAGQFVNIYLDDKSMLLPRPISICMADKDSITIVYRIAGKGTTELSTYAVGTVIRVSTPLGNGYFIDGTALGGKTETYADRKVAVVGGGIGVPPMVLLAKKLKEKGALVTAVVGFQAEPFLIEELKLYCEKIYVATDNGSVGFHGNAVQLIQKEAIEADEFFSCGPKVMLKALSKLCTEKAIPCQVSLEERMGCGYGACVGCTCKIKVQTENGVEIQQKGVCKHGPVFFGEEVAWDE
ncbi:dihydroorotate dehydrogenase electron transfer subunit [Clostridium aminobutyricum]|uniref:Dihydroorotate dehydrogenase electron transfer subunit n=1 Tax=Clostridium aminobutyricum TaxID=33953 RepID=A0A939D5V7_CLOAM|nr:dihydroorotate dehydrogenase electron transfer subunit [Clostridium aminobutyricum]MBN7771969.1 dihydroorotate dehydrogenase electron transfer subunit [Clostridium aminobutyricum]